MWLMWIQLETKVQVCHFSLTQKEVPCGGCRSSHSMRWKRFLQSPITNHTKSFWRELHDKKISYFPHFYCCLQTLLEYKLYGRWEYSLNQQVVNKCWQHQITQWNETWAETHSCWKWPREHRALINAFSWSHMLSFQFQQFIQNSLNNPKNHSKSIILCKQVLNAFSYWGAP